MSRHFWEKVVVFSGGVVWAQSSQLRQIAGCAGPLVLVPSRMFVQFPVVFTLEGQYAFKDIILIGAALVIGAATMSKLARDRKRKTSDWKRVDVN